MTYQLKLSPGIAEVLQLDELSMCQNLGIVVVQWAKTFILVAGDEAGFRNLLDDCKHRQDGGWDQPVWYSNSARSAEKKVQMLLARITLNCLNPRDLVK